MPKILVAGLASAMSLVMSTLLTTPAVAALEPPVPAVRKLDNPRQLGLTRDGTLIIAESGRGGPHCVQQACFGTTGAVSMVRRPSEARDATAERVVTGLLSEAGPSGAGASGNDGASAQALGRIFVAKDVDVPSAISHLLPGEQAGKLLRSTVAGKSPTVFADIRGYEAANDPDGQGVESNPYAVLDLGDRVLVADAAANAILAVDGGGRISVFAVLPVVRGGACDTRPNQGGLFCDPVPTSLTFSRDGDILVAGLGSLVPGAGRVWELDSSDGRVQQEWAGFTGVHGAAQDQEGNLYVSELFSRGGQLVMVPSEGDRATLAVPNPGGVVADRAGNVYVSVNALSPGTGTGAAGSDGQVWRLTKRSFQESPAGG